MTPLPSESDGAFLQRCKLTCAQAAGCVGFNVTQCEVGGRCCRLHEMRGSMAGYFLPTPTIYVKVGDPSSHGHSMAVDASGSDATVVVVNPWDDSYGGADVAVNETLVTAPTGSEPVNVVQSVDVELHIGGLLTDWRVLTTVLFGFMLGLLIGGATIYTCMLRAKLQDASRVVSISKAVDAAGPAPVHGATYAQGHAFTTAL